MSKKGNLKIFYAISLAGQLGFMIMVPIGISIFLGISLDNFLNTQPFLLILFSFLGIGFTFYELYHTFIVLVKDNEEVFLIEDDEGEDE